MMEKASISAGIAVLCMPMARPSTTAVVVAFERSHAAHGPEARGGVEVAYETHHPSGDDTQHTSAQRPPPDGYRMSRRR